MDSNPPIYLSLSESKYLSDILNSISESRFVFLLGAPGMGKSTIIKKALEALENHLGYKSYYFDYQDGEKKKAIAFYQEIINTISEKEKEIKWGSNPYIPFIFHLEQQVTQPTVLAFDNLNALNKDFYDHFSQDCRAIYNEAKVDPHSNLSKITIIFGGFLKKSDKGEISPLWNITDQIEILPIPEDERQNIIISHFEQCEIENPPKKLVERIDQATSGHHYLITDLVKHIHQKKGKIFQADNKGFEWIINSYIEYVWSLYSTPEKELYENDKALKKHFEGMIEYFETKPKVLQIGLDLADNRKCQGARLPRIDEITITGAIHKDDEGNYAFSNDIYKKLFIKLIEGHRKADFCLFHADQEEFYKKAIDIYKDLLKKGTRRKRGATLAPRLKQTDYLMIKLINRLRSCADLHKFTNEFRDMVSLVFDIRKWGLFTIDIQGKKIREVDPLFNSKTYRWAKEITDAEIEGMDTFIHNVVDSVKPMTDWTGQWMVIPVIISEDFNRLFISENRNLFSKNWNQVLAKFIQEALTVYHYLDSKIRMENRALLLKNRLEGLSQLQTGSLHRERMNPLWMNAKSLFQQIGITDYTIYEHIRNYKDFKGGAFLKNNYSYESWSPKEGAISYNLVQDKLKKAVESVRNNIKGYYSNESQDFHYIGRKMESLDALMILELPIETDKFKDLRTQIEIILDIMKFNLDIGYELHKNENDFNLYKNAMSASEDYAYLVNRKMQIVFSNPKMDNWISSKITIKENRKDIPCYEQIFGYSNKCDSCIVDKVYATKKLVRISRNFEMINGGDKKMHTMECAFVPIYSSNSNLPEDIAAVAVFMHDLTNYQILWRALETLEALHDIGGIENCILKTLNDFGFKRVFSYQHNPKKKGHFISDDMIGATGDENKENKFKSGGIDFISEDIDLLQGHVSPWCRRKTPPADETRSFLDNRLGGSTEFRLKESTSESWPEYQPDSNRPNFWVSMPILGDDGSIVKLFAMDNHGDEEHDKEMISLDKLQLLETFGRASGQILENAQQREYLKRFQAMLCHGTIEPLGALRMSIDELIDEENISEREQFVNEAQAALDMVDASLGSLMTTERGPARIIKEEINLNKFLKEQTGLLKIYAEKSLQISFDLDLPQESVRFITDKTVLTQILNNLVGNSLKHFRKEKVKGERKITVQLYKGNGNVTIIISDTGEGLPTEIKQYFTMPYRKGMRYPLGGLGLGFSREMAEMLKGKLEYLPTDKGTTFKLTLGRYGKMNRSNEAEHTILIVDPNPIYIRGRGV